MEGRIAIVSGHYIPESNASLKYELVGEISKLNHELYSRRHGIPYLNFELRQDSSLACFEKIPAILEAMENHEWVLWLDSDVLISNMDFSIESICNSKYDFISQCPEKFFDSSSIPLELRKEIMPLNTGAFLIKSSAFSREILQTTYSRRISPKREPWDGLGEQEVLLDILSKAGQLESNVGYDEHIQCHPGYWNSDVFSIHFYGNYAEHRFSKEQCLNIISEWNSAIIEEQELPLNREYFHWCLIQLKKAKGKRHRRNPEFFLYPKNLFPHSHCNLI